MQNRIKIFLFLTALSFLSYGSVFYINVKNTTPYERKGEIIEISDSLLVDNLHEGFRTVYDAKGNKIEHQILSDGTLLLPVTIKPYKSESYVLISCDENITSDTVCYGRIFPERLDDLAWENDKAAYRAYGPALQKTGEKAFGYDIWTKNVEFPVLEKRYHGALKKGISFHKDHGEGMDIYAVGPTLGGGTTALLDKDGKLIMPYCWKEAKVLESGPLRFEAEMIFDIISDGNTPVTEHRIVTLDRGEWLNSTEVWYEGVDSKSNFVAGIVVHDSNPKAYRFYNDEPIVFYEDLTQESDADNGVIFVGLIGPEGSVADFIPVRDIPGVTGHAVLRMTDPVTPKSYWWGGAWSKGGMKSVNDWEKYLIDFRNRKLNPLQINVTRIIK